MAAAEPIRDKKQLKEMAAYYLQRNQFRNYVLLIMGVHTALRVSDLLRITWEDVRDAEKGAFKTRINLTEKKTGKRKSVALNKEIIGALRLYYPHRKGVYLFASNRKDGGALTRVQAYRIIRAAANGIGAEGCISCHSLRKTFGYHAWKNGVPAVLLMDIYNHSSYEITRRYLGVSQDDRDNVYLQMALF